MNQASTAAAIALATLWWSVGCMETEAPAEPIDVKKQAPSAAVESRLREPVPTPGEEERKVGGVPVPRRAKVTFENDGTYNLSVTQTIDQLRDFYVGRGYQPVSHPEGFAIFVSERGPIVQVLKGVGPRSEIVVIEKVFSDAAPPPAQESVTRKTAEQIKEIEKRLNANEPTESLPQPPESER